MSGSFRNPVWMEIMIDKYQFRKMFVLSTGLSICLLNYDLFDCLWWMTGRITERPMGNERLWCDTEQFWILSRVEFGKVDIEEKERSEIH